MPGVGTKFEEVGDSGEGYNLREDRPKGLAFCYKGENRIIWALVEAINHVHKYYTDEPLIRDEEFKARFNKLTLPCFGDTMRRSYPRIEFDQPSHVDRLESAFSEALVRLHERLNIYLPIGPGKSRDKGVVKNIYCAMFGFSRGATEARAFTNWFIWLCKLDARIAGAAGLSLGTIPVTIDFLGLFDTVASVGLAASALIADGHQAWADADDSLRIPLEPAQCLHLVSGHEARRSFPLDSVLYRGTLPPNCTEIVFPGVHSDIGGGYPPFDQGRGKDPEGADLISRITLAVMYRAARLAGVPLKLENAPESAKRAFHIDPSVIQAFNAYINAYRNMHGIAPDKPVTGPLHELMEQQHKLYIQWRKKMHGKMAGLPVFKAADQHDREDLMKADQELGDEIGYFENWRRNRYRDGRFSPVPEWEAIDDYWEQPAPSSAVTDLFDQFVHDSRAWFKPLGKDVGDLQHEMEMLAVRNEKAREWEGNYHDSGQSNPYLLSASDKQKLERYQLYKEEHKDSDDYREAITPESKGREPMWLGGGYLRYRKIYMGSDSFKPSGAKYAGLAPLQDRGRHMAMTDSDQLQAA